ncbi:PP2C family protein-serine/threonine phosphatase [Catenuloplanes japonicus]|uniref:PP2C family protein-serine/threonine phosphatase n=1 Tax=Catenuloplanes japonicus TaxID=33876 RepID=UPI000526E713|nr:GAF domain-containing SpoIIE family protein phosphatase [Catenuloplanes japonicus]
MTTASDTGAGQRLRRIEALTDVSLSRLHGAALLDALLERTCRVLDVDTAVVLLVDRHSHQLVVTAAHGLQEEVRRRIRIPHGRGFAGQVAATGEPLVVEQVTAATVASPVLIDAGLRSLLGVPIFAGGEVVGVVHVGSLTSRGFTADDVRLLQLVADRAAVATTARTAVIDDSAAHALQRSLLPTRLPDVPGVDLAARYVPGHQAGLGGDWYDVFPLPSGRLGLVIGDVSGHGLQAAVVMGRLRSALRAYALTSDDPSVVLTQLDHKVHHFEAGNLATVAYATISPDRATVLLSLAGHPPPILAAPGVAAGPVGVPADPPLGLWSSRYTRRTTGVRLPAGGVLVCYTDGLVERRDEIIDVGIDRLTGAVRPDTAETVCTAIMELLGLEQPADDVALLAVHRGGPQA